MTKERAPTGLLRLVVVLVGVHSLVLGAALLFAPVRFVEVFGFPSADTTFFPTQSGAFLVALGLCYLLALRDRVFVWTILVSKSVAVVFLFGHYLFLDAPPSVLAAGIGDLIMLALTLVALRLEAPGAGDPG